MTFRYNINDDPDLILHAGKSAEVVVHASVLERCAFCQEFREDTRRVLGYVRWGELYGRANVAICDECRTRGEQLHIDKAEAEIADQLGPAEDTDGEDQRPTDRDGDRPGTATTGNTGDGGRR